MSFARAARLNASDEVWRNTKKQPPQIDNFRFEVWMARECGAKGLKRNKHEGKARKPSKSFGENLGCRSNCDMIVLDDRR